MNGTPQHTVPAFVPKSDRPFTIDDIEIGLARQAMKYPYAMKTLVTLTGEPEDRVRARCLTEIDSDNRKRERERVESTYLPLYAALGH